MQNKDKRKILPWKKNLKIIQLTIRIKYNIINPYHMLHTFPSHVTYLHVFRLNLEYIQFRFPIHQKSHRKMLSKKKIICRNNKKNLVFHQFYLLKIHQFFSTFSMTPSFFLVFHISFPRAKI